MQKKIKSRRTESCTYKKRLPPFLLLCLPSQSTCADDRIIKSTLKSKKQIVTLQPGGAALVIIRPSGICINSAKVPVHLFPINSTQNNIKSRRTESFTYKKRLSPFLLLLAGRIHLSRRANNKIRSADRRNR
jgi:hypothetical protein